MLRWKIAALAGVALGIGGVTWGYAQRSQAPDFLNCECAFNLRLNRRYL